MVAFDSNSMSKLCSADQLELLNSIDDLRHQGINNYISLPQIIVCGDQSSGKSSVLEAISGVSFPVKSNLCTRFPTELVLRRARNVGATVSIVPHNTRNEAERKALGGFESKMSSFGDLPGIIENAKLAMGISTHGKAFSKDILRIEISGPDRPHLTIVDLPGLIHSETKHQTAADVELIQDVVQGYMKESRCIILAVVSAKNDFANQIVLKLARAADSAGTRTLGVITKPDTLRPGSGNEVMYVSLARNQEVEFRLGWHVLKNMDSDAGTWTLEERDKKEEEFFAEGAWTELPRASLGIDRLRGRLSRVLLRQIALELPGLIDEIDDKSKDCALRLQNLGMPRSELQVQRRYLFELSHAFQALIKSSVDGTYGGPFFGDAKTSEGYKKRIRAVVQNMNQKFAAELATNGHYREITDDSDPRKLVAIPQFGKGGPISRKSMVNHIDVLINRTKGRELPGTFNPLIVTDLFLEQSRPWAAIVRAHVQSVWESARVFVNLVIAHVADESTAKMMKEDVFGPAMDNILKDMESKTTELLSAHQDGHPITYNQYFTETLQSLRRERMEREITKTVTRFFSVASIEDAGLTYLDERHELKNLVSSLALCNQPNMDRFAAEEALDCLQAYYKVALKRFIDDVSVEVMESQLLSKLADILSAISIFDMPDVTISRLAGESEDSRNEREKLTRQLQVLKSGLDTCRRFVSVRLGGASAFASIEYDDQPAPDSGGPKTDKVRISPQDKGKTAPKLPTKPLSPIGLVASPAVSRKAKRAMKGTSKGKPAAVADGSGTQN